MRPKQIQLAALGDSPRDSQRAENSSQKQPKRPAERPQRITMHGLLALIAR